ncbi:MAG: hypothetical protein JWR26_529 [Pedosphaera sp.]|nr:hypothetical protein [Pedosphaera sp.]
MNPQNEMTTATDTPQRSGLVPLLHRLVFISFLICTALWCGCLLGIFPTGAIRWTEPLLPLLALATTLMTLARNLPVQNVITAAVLISLFAGIVQIVGEKTGIPFGPYYYTDNFGPALFGLLPWPAPIIWVVAMLNSRGIARLIMRPWRKMGKYGFWVIGLTCVIMVIFDLGLEPFGTRVSHYWAWRAPKTVPAWYAAPWVNFLGWAVTALLILVFVTPWLINKNRGSSKAPRDYQPLIVWLCLSLLFAAGDAGQGLWWAAGFTLAASAIVTIFALRGARW